MIAGASVLYVGPRHEGARDNHGFELIRTLFGPGTGDMWAKPSPRQEGNAANAPYAVS